MNMAKGRKLSHLRGLGLTLPAVLAAAPAAHALTLYDGSNHGNNLEINLDITATWTGAVRAGKPNQAIVSGAQDSNGNDGDANLRRGLIDDNFEVVPVLDIKDGTLGMHFSGEYFLNTVYLGTNQNNQGPSVNPVMGKATDYASETRQSNGNNGRLLDAFVYDTWNFGGDQSFTLKAGQQTLFWGQALFSTNGISGGQAPIDVVQALNFANPAPQAQSIFLPVGQIVATYQPNTVYTIQGYYQYQWEPYGQEGVGSYFSTADVSGPGTQRIVIAPGPTYGTGTYLGHIRDLTPPSQNGEFGISVQAQYGNYDVGLYTLRYDSKTPATSPYILAPTAATPSQGGLQLGQFHYVFPRDIWLYGTSVSTTVGATNVAGELSVRTHMPLVAGQQAGVLAFANEGNASNDPLYPVGNVMTGVANFIYGSPSLSFDPGGITMEGELEYNSVFRVTRNADQLAPGRSQQNATLTLSVTPSYFEVLPNLELQFPVTLIYDPWGNSEVWISENKGTGQYSFGVTAIYKQNWDASLLYQGYFGTPGGNPGVPGTQTLADRAFVALSLTHTF